jgi:hypothetical protein
MMTTTERDREIPRTLLPSPSCSDVRPSSRFASAGLVSRRRGLRVLGRAGAADGDALGRDVFVNQLAIGLPGWRSVLEPLRSLTRAVPVDVPLMPSASVCHRSPRVCLAAEDAMAALLRHLSVR